MLEQQQQRKQQSTQKLNPKNQLTRLRIAIQKQGRLNENSIELLRKCGLNFENIKNELIVKSKNFPIDILFVRDDDIPTMVLNGICDLGIVGENVLFEQQIEPQINTVMGLGFGRCRLSIALPVEKKYQNISDLNNCIIATSYPNLLRKYLTENQLNAEIITLNGSVEIAPKLAMADAICDLVASGRTLEDNHLKEVVMVIESQAVLIQSLKSLSAYKQEMINLLESRMYGVLQAQESKYILFHSPRAALPEIIKILPGAERPTILPLDGMEDKVVVHLVSKEGFFWKTLERLKEVGASSILVLPIEKMLN